MNTLLDFIAMTAYIVGFVGVLGLIAFLIVSFIIYPAKTKRIRKEPRLFEHCRFYDGEDKLSGQIRSIDEDDDMIEVQYVDYNVSLKRKWISKNELYPAW